MRGLTYTSGKVVRALGLLVAQAGIALAIWPNRWIGALAIGGAVAAGNVAVVFMLTFNPPTPLGETPMSLGFGAGIAVVGALISVAGAAVGVRNVRRASD